MELHTPEYTVMYNDPVPILSYLLLPSAPLAEKMVDRRSSHHVGACCRF